MASQTIRKIEKTAEDVRKTILKRQKPMLKFPLRSLSNVKYDPKAGFFVWIPTPPGYTSMEFSQALLEQAGVLVIPGVGYGENGEGYVRMSLTINGDKAGERVTEAIRRIRESVALPWG